MSTVELFVAPEGQSSGEPSLGKRKLCARISEEQRLGLRAEAGEESDG